MQVHVYNTMTRRKELFRPIDTGKVRMYNCGPTVYDQAHIGNMRTYVMADVIRRAFEYLGYEVRQVMNITDVGHLTSDADEGEDRMLVGARRTGRDPWEIAAHYSRLFFEDCAALNIQRPHVVCKATEHIPEMIDLVQRLANLGYTYEIDDGIYFDVGRFPDYGRLSGQTLDDMRAGARVAVNPKKRHPADFALWRKATPEHIMQWDSPWGRGYPGWHIECSAMSMKYLGETLDIHTGGEDHIATHHPNEIAQSEAATGKPFAHYWMHGRFLRWSEDDRRMSKSSGEFLVVGDLVARGYDPLAFRYHCLTGSYRVPLTFSWDSLERAADGLGRLQENVRRLGDEAGDTSASDLASPLAEQPAANNFVGCSRANNSVSNSRANNFVGCSHRRSPMTWTCRALWRSPGKRSTRPTAPPVLPTNVPCSTWRSTLTACWDSGWPMRLKAAQVRCRRPSPPSSSSERWRVQPATGPRRMPCARRSAGKGTN